MRATQTFVVDVARLHRQGGDGTLVVRLMRAADDIALANWGLAHYSKPQARLRGHVQQGARRYFVRLQCGHLTEALKLVEEVRNSRRLKSVVARCEPFAREAYQRLCECLPGGARRSDFEVQVRSVRNRAAFHYDPSLVAKAIASRARRPESAHSTITRGSEMDLWRSGLADDIEDTIVCRYLWKIPLTTDLRAEADRISDFGFRLCRDFLDLVGDVTIRFLRDTSTV